MNHETWMQRCLELASRGAGSVSPNPMVGAVVVGQEGNLLGEGWHERYGAAHAEVNAIAAAEAAHGADALRRATLYVNLEPCSHSGKTPPCTRLILEKQIPRVVAGMIDPFPAVSGSGVAHLKEQGVAVVVGVLEAECRRLNEAFLQHVRIGRPLVTLKMAATLDGQVATRTGDSRWVSGEASRRLVHRWRGETDAVLVGSRTARADDPALTVRHVSGRQPLRIVLDREACLPASLQLFSDAFVSHTVAVVSDTALPPVYEKTLLAHGGRLIRIREKDGRLDLAHLFALSGTPDGVRETPVQSVLVEAGPGLATALFTQDLVDRFSLFIAPKLAGAGMPLLRGLEIPRMSAALAFAAQHWEPVGEDMLFRGYLRRL